MSKRVLALILAALLMGTLPMAQAETVDADVAEAEVETAAPEGGDAGGAGNAEPTDGVTEVDGTDEAGKAAQLSVANAEAAAKGLTVFGENGAQRLIPAETLPKDASYDVLETLPPDSDRFAQAWTKLCTLVKIGYTSPVTGMVNAGWLVRREPIAALEQPLKAEAQPLRIELRNVSYTDETAQGENEITVYASGKTSPQQTLHYEIHSADSARQPLRLLDMNFDGWLDLEALDTVDEAGRQCRYFLWNPDNSAFEPCEALSTLRDFRLLESREIADRNLIAERTVNQKTLAACYTLYGWQEGKPMQRAFGLRTVQDRDLRQYGVGADGASFDQSFDAKWYRKRYDAQDRLLQTAVFGRGDIFDAETK